MSMTTTRRQFLSGTAALGALVAVGAAGAGAAAAHPERHRPSRNLVKNGSFEKGPLGGPRIADWVVTVAPA